MNTRLTWPSRLPVIALLAAAVGSFVHAEPQARQQPAQELLSLQFRGGTAAEYVAAIRRQAPMANVLVDSGAEKVPMPALELNRVTVRTALELLDSRHYKGTREQIEMDVRRIRNHPDEEDTFHVRTHVIGTHRPMETHVWSIAEVLEREMTDDAVLAAVRLALEVVDSPNEADVRFHEDTGLIIARGDGEQLSAINDVVARLKDAIKPPPEAGAGAKGLLQERNALHLEMERLAVRLESLERLVAQKEAELNNAHKELRSMQAALDSERRRSEQP
ncbi:MAG: hypothetical protein ACYS0D_08245 [Planctomycetota bacterium]|jgi:hypothetical protein